MAANNYYGFTHAGTQFGTQYTPTTGQQYATQQQYGSASVPPPPATGYGDYIGGYTRPAGQPGTSTSTGYAGYAQTAPPAPVPTAGTPAKPLTNYDAAVYNAVSAYAQSGRTSGYGFKRGGGGGNMMRGKGRIPPKPQTLHYCDVCKISCAGPQTYKEHLDGQKHKKKEALMKAGAPPIPKSGPVGLRCELCDVTCTGNDAYAAHIRGSKHLKVMKLHTKLGKPIPSDNPTVLAPANSSHLSSSSTSSLKKVPLTQNSAAPSNTFVKPVATPKISFVGSRTEGDRYLHVGPVTDKEENGNYASNAAEGTRVDTSTLNTSYPLSAVGPMPPPVQDDQSLDALYLDKDIEPVGMDYIEEVRNDDGKGFSFNCKLCDCKFNDPNAKEMHMKGRRHRLQYKKKVDPDLVVDIKPSNRLRKMDERRGRGRRGFGHPGSGGNRRERDIDSDSYGRPPPPPLMSTGQRGYGHGHGPMSPMYPPQGNHMHYMSPPAHRTESRNDRQVMAKHAEIYPADEELHAIQRIVSSTERALKLVSDEIAETDSKVSATHIEVNTEDTKGTEEPDTTVEQNATATDKPQVDLQAFRVLKGVMRVGNLAKGLLLHGDRKVELAVLCSVKPTVSLLEKVLAILPKHFETVSPDEKFDIQRELKESGFIVSSLSEPKIDVLVIFTSPLVRSSSNPESVEATATTVEDPTDLLDKEKCLDALAALRHAKWFQARATLLQSCVIVIRILRELCKRVPAWKEMDPWVVELLTEKVLSSTGIPMSPGEGLQLVFEVLASNFIFPTGPGLLDPCEKESVDAFDVFSPQARVDITNYAQHAFRLIKFGQIHKVLDMEELAKFKNNDFGSRKRRRISSAGGEAEDTELKKDKKESENTMEVSQAVKPETTESLE